MINPFQIMQMMRGSSDPMQTLMGMAQTNPQIGQVLQMVNGKTPAQIRQMVHAEAQRRGVDLNQLAQQMGVRLPK